jgi:y4mF family transcriptional regulator
MFTIHTTDQLGTALRTARKQLGLTQPQLALAAGVGTRFIVDLEAGKPTVRLEHVLRVIDALGGALQLTGLPDALPEDAAGRSAVAVEGAGHGA